MKATICSALLLTASLVSSAAAAPVDGFPVDPAGVKVLDRFYNSYEVQKGTLELYAVMYAGDAHHDKVDIYSGTSSAKGMEWKKLYTWNVPKGPEAVNVLAAYQADNVIQLSSVSWFAYQEGRAVPILDYNSVTGKFQESLAD